MCCTNGHIFEINLNTGVNKLLVKQDNINFIYSYFYLDEQLIGGKNIKIYNLLLCGKDILSEKYSLTELSYTIELKKNDIDVNFSNLTYLTDKVNCVLFIQSEKLYNSLIVLGTLDGKIILTESPISKVDHKLKELYLHKGAITKLLYSKETHLLFSCGDDGNIFILVIQEIGGDEAFYESLITNINLITHIGDSGLGENVLIPAWDMNRIEKTKGKKNILEKEFEEEKKEILKKNENELNGIIKDMKNKHNEELTKLIDRISELELEMKRQKEENKDNYNFIINEMNKKQTDESNLYEAASADYEKEITLLKNELSEIELMYEDEIDFIEKEYQKKFFDLRKDFEKRTKAINDEDEKIEKKYLREKEDKNVFVTNLEVENEIDNKNILIEQDKINDEYKNKIKKLNQEILNLKKKHIELEEILEDKERDINLLQSRVNFLEETSQRIREQNNSIDKDTKNLSEKIIELKKILENNKITSTYEEKLRKELYKKNTEINIKYKDIMKEYNSQKDNNKILERNINSVNTKALLIEDGRGKAHLALSASERENIKLKRKAKQLKNLFEEIIAKVYKSLQTINKNEVYKCACELYKLFLTEEYKNTINKSTLDMDILYEFNIKIQGLEKKLKSDKSHMKYLQEHHDKYKIKMFVENSSLLSGCTNATKKSVNLMKNAESLNTEIKLLEETKINNNSSSSVVIGNSNHKNKNKSKFTKNSNSKIFMSNSSRDLLPPISNSNYNTSLNRNIGGTFGSENSSKVINEYNEDESNKI